MMKITEFREQQLFIAGETRPDQAAKQYGYGVVA